MPGDSASPEAHLPLNCPRCGGPLTAYRPIAIGREHSEAADVYLCYVHGFFTFTVSKGLEAKHVNGGTCR
jgi:hypothetical protein